MRAGAAAIAHHACARARRDRLALAAAPALPGLGVGLWTWLRAHLGWTLGTIQVPLKVAGVLLALATTGWALLPAGWPLPFVAGLGLSYLAWRWAPEGPDRAIGLPILLTGGVEAGLVWLLGPVSGAFIGWLAMVVVWCGLWLAYGRLLRLEGSGEGRSPKVRSDGANTAPRARICARTKNGAGGRTFGPADDDGAEPRLRLLWGFLALLGRLRRPPEPDPEPPSLAELLGPAVEAWEAEHGANVGLPGVGLQLVEAGDGVAHLRLELPSGLTLQDVVPRLGRIGVALAWALRPAGVRVPPDALRLERDPRRAELAHLYLTLRNPLDPSRSYPGQSGARWADPACIAFAGGSEVLRIDLNERNVLALGIKGSGKTHGLFGLVIEKATPDVAFFAIEVGKGGADLRKLEPRLERLATTPATALETLLLLERIRVARARRFADEGMHVWPVSPEAPQIVLVVDELSALLEYVPEAERLLTGFGNRGRQQAISLWLANQRAVGETWVGAFCDVRLCFRVGLETDARAVLGNLVQEGWDPIRGLPLPGSMLAYVPGEHMVNRPWRTWDLGEGGCEVPRWARELALTKPDMSAEIAAATEADPPVAELAARPQTSADRLDALLLDAGPEGMATSEIVAAMRERGMSSKDTVHAHLRARHDSIGHGRWRHRDHGEGRG